MHGRTGRARANAVVAAADEASLRLGQLQLEYGEASGQEGFDLGKPSLVLLADKGAM
jgi:hypothetical protein